MVRFAIALFLAMSAVCAAALADSDATHPIVFSDTGILLGGSGNGEWLTAAEVAPSLKGAEQYRVYGLNGRVGETTGDIPESFGAPCPDSQLVNMSSLRREKEEGDLPINMVALAADWDAVPRKPVRYLTNQKVYHEAAAAFLEEQGIESPDVRLRQVIRVDLEGDGVDEVLVAGTRFTENDSAGAKPGDYSFIFMRKLAGGKLETVTIAADIHVGPTPNDFPYFFRVAALMDLNGDGIMEIVIASEYYEGGAVAVITVDGLKVDQVLIEGCGA